jgi:hypothetical protein
MNAAAVAESATAADAGRERALQQKYALSYHIPFAMLAERLEALRR